MNRVRCAIYTRKSSEEGLEQSFNSLDAQREACEAYIRSQKHEGWQALSTHYDDGGFSGGNMDRPAIKQLMADIAAGKINTVVVYKVDRLTRSLADFAKIIEQFDSKQVSFVSVTQQFNTTTSMGRLTLNVLLSFAQFEREVTGERIRDKIAASKQRGMWMGGCVPLGYDLRDRRLYVNTEEAERIREIFRQYTELGCVSGLKERLDRGSIRSKVRSANGRQTGGERFSRGALYKILRNHIYVGEIAHKGAVYHGDHEPIINREQWDKVQTMLVEHRQGVRRESRATKSSLLTGLLFDESGNRFTPTHANKAGRRYRYYTSQAVIRKASAQGTASRIPAHALEEAVTERILECLRSPGELLGAVKGLPDGDADFTAIVKLGERQTTHWSALSVSDQEIFLRLIINRVIIHSDLVEIRIDADTLLRRLLDEHRTSFPTSHEEARSGESRLFSLSCPFRQARQGKALRLIIGNNQVPPATSTSAIIKAIARARLWYDQIVAGEVACLPELAARHGVIPQYVNRIFRFISLGPDAIEAIIKGECGASLSLDSLVSRIPLEWAGQASLLLDGWQGIPSVGHSGRR